MNKAKARKLLEARRADLEQVSRAAIEQVSLDDPQGAIGGETSGYDQHTADAATDTVEREMALSVQESTEAHIRDIDAALARLESGTYGICEVCGTKIPEGRLEAKPEAAYCVEHEPPPIESEGAA
jgi:RNA polymerase-binding transcription factor DksA